MKNYILKTTLAISGILLFVLFTSCFSSRKKNFSSGKNKLATSVSQASQLNAAEKAILSKIEGHKIEKFDKGDIDTTIFINISRKVDQYIILIDSVGNAVKFIENAFSSKSEYQKNKKSLKKNLALIESYLADSSKRLRRFNMIDDGLYVSKKNEFNLAAFFGPGKYQIPPDKISVAEQSFAPIIDSLMKFYNKYSDVNKTGTLIILGFADGTGFNPASQTYKIISDTLKMANPPKELLNQKLSELRANSLGRTMTVILNQKLAALKPGNNGHFIFVESGKGETFPDKNITNYTADDERRRVVLFYWNILPSD